MEALLNLFWLILAVAAFGVWAVKLGKARPKTRFSTCVEAVALVCILVLLFFSISLTDDLHSEIILITDSASSRRSAPFVSAVKLHKQSATLRSPVLVAVLQTRTSISLDVSCGLINQWIVPLQFFLSRPPSNRAPPVLAV